MFFVFSLGFLYICILNTFLINPIFHIILLKFIDLDLFKVY